MNFAFVKTPSFIFGLLLFTIMALLAIFSLHLSIFLTIIILCSVVLLHIINEYYKNKQLTKKIIGNEIKRLLSTAQEFSSKFGQRIRSNIFFLKKINDKKKYYIRYHYNMDTFDDKHIEIDENMGCTGEAWRTKSQVWGNKKKIFAAGKYRIDDEELRKVPEDLEWICSTPIVDENGEVIAVMNFDGTGDLTPTQVRKIRIHCHAICEELKNILL